jgi:hypothetical protein
VSEVNPYAQFRTTPEPEEEEKERDNPYAQFREIVDATPVGFMNKAASRFAPDMVEAAEDTANMLSNPVDTAKAAAEAVANLFKMGRRGLVNKATEGIKSLVEDPGQVADAVAEHPFDTAMMFYGGGVSQGARPIASTLKGTANTAAGVGHRLYRSDMGIPKSMGREGLDIAKFGSRNKIHGTLLGKKPDGEVGYRSGMENLEMKQADAGQELREMVQGYADGWPAVPRSVIEQDLKALRADFKGDYNEVAAV